jgi:hypothetical protein
MPDGSAPYSSLSHLECSRTGERYGADEVQGGFSKVGAPLSARYDLDDVRASYRTSGVLPAQAAAGRGLGT